MISSMYELSRTKGRVSINSCIVDYPFLCGNIPTQLQDQHTVHKLLSYCPNGVMSMQHLQVLLTNSQHGFNSDMKREHTMLMHMIISYFLASSAVCI